MNIDELLEPGGIFKSALFGTLLRDHVDVVELPVGTRVGPYSIEGPLGSGGMGIVYLGRRADGQFERRVAIKFLARRVAAPQLHDDFRRERRIVAALNHAHIAHLLDGGVMEDGRLWFAAELIEGLPIDRYCVHKDLDVRRRVALLCPVVAAVQYAHSQLLVHRDIKPSNVYVDRERGAKLLDFGVATFTDENDEAIAYTPGYASPEQLAGERIGTASDIWQLGNLLRLVIEAHAEGAPAPAIPADLAAIIAKACARPAARRYHTAQGLHDDLMRFLAREPVRARPATARYRLQRFVARHPFGVAAGALVSLLFGGLLALGWRLNAARSAAVNERELTVAVTRFLTDDLIAEANPYGGSGHPVVDFGNVLSKASQHAAQTFASHTHLADEIDLALATALEGMDRVDDAEKIVDRALPRVQAAEPKDFELVASFRALSATLAIDAGRVQEARTDLLGLQEEVTPVLGRRHPLALHIAALIGVTDHLLQQPQECERVLSRVVQERQTLQPFDSLLASSALAECSAQLGHYDVALPMAQAQIASNAALFGATDPRTLVARAVELVILLDAGEFGRVIDTGPPLADQALATLGPADATYGDVLADVGYAAACSGNYELARQDLDLALQVKSKPLATRSEASAKGIAANVAKARVLLAVLQVRTHEEHAAEETLALAAAALKDQQATNAYATLLATRGELRLAQARYADAAADFERALEIYRAAKRADLPRNAPIKLGLAVAYAHLGRNAETQPLLADAKRTLGERRTCMQPLVDAASRTFADFQVAGAHAASQTQ